MKGYIQKAETLIEALPRIQLADESRIRAEEERTRKAMVAASEGKEDAAQEPIRNTETYGRNDEVTITNGTETRTMKYKKAEPFIGEGWTIVK